MRIHNRMTAVALRENNPGQRDRRPRTGIDSQRTNLLERATRDQQNTAYRTFAGNTEVRQEIESQPVQLGAREKTDVGLPVPQSLRAVNRKIETEIEEASLGAMKESPDQRPRVQVAYSGNDQSSVYTVR